MKNIETLKKEDMNLADKIYIFDTTLRDGEQTPGVALTVDEKMQIAQKLNNLGVDKIEVGFPASSKGEIESAKRINSLSLDSTLVGLARSLERDIDAVIERFRSDGLGARLQQYGSRLRHGIVGIRRQCAAAHRPLVVGVLPGDGHSDLRR